ncbi:RDD family protein [Sporosarcina gallistercoris]|uniref:RDD family protein n=1 Tax=Sporosarcina gallistercoris TaxID=2762245 RepID=A0ABR8PEY1_9BACL|nr:RDD family protein [Sporosarcina gallistercoris]MBD7906717.1 RDD family protein [Sporosarcina gallistercoris]
MIYTNRAGLGVRAVANFLDFVLLATLFATIFYFVTGSFSFNFANGFAWQTFYTLYLIILPIIWSGYVIGKRICHIQVKRVDDGNVTFFNMFMREIVGNVLLGTLTFGVSILISAGMIVFREDKRGIHDFVGGTYVRRN